MNITNAHMSRRTRYLNTGGDSNSRFVEAVLRTVPEASGRGAPETGRPELVSIRRRLLQAESCQVDGVGRVEREAAHVTRQHNAVVEVVAGSPRRLVLEHAHVEVAVRAVALRTRQQGCGAHLRVVLRIVEVGDVVVVRVVQAVA